jgi:SAM-dependent methyltransferase
MRFLSRRSAAAALVAAWMAGATLGPGALPFLPPVLLPFATAQAQDEVPFIVTPDAVTLAMLQLAQVKASDHVIDLGSGDGRIVILAAKRFGASGLGVEIVPELVQRSLATANKAGVAARVDFKVQDLFETDLSRATVVTMYLNSELNLLLRPALLALAPGTRIVSHDWHLGDWAPLRSVTMAVPEKEVGLNKRSTVHLWVVPARVAGLWCAPGVALQIDQRFDRFTATVRDLQRERGQTTGPAAVVFDGQVGVDKLYAGQEARTAATQFSVQGQSLVLDAGIGAAARWAGLRFERSQGADC